jgi:hypothetical protein
MRNATEIGTLKQLTHDGCSIYPVFSQGDTIALYRRLLITDLQDTIAYFPEQMTRVYGININNNELYTAQGNYNFPEPMQVPKVELPRMQYEDADWGIRSPDTGFYAFETISTTANKIRNIYLAHGDSINQLSYGNTPCYLDRFSNTGRYLTAVYSKGPTWILIFDLKKNQVFKINRESANDSLVDYMTCFSPTDDKMLFIRSNKQYRGGSDFFGDVWLFKFDKNN